MEVQILALQGNVFEEIREWTETLSSRQLKVELNNGLPEPDDD